MNLRSRPQNCAIVNYKACRSLLLQPHTPKISVNAFVPRATYCFEPSRKIPQRNFVSVFGMRDKIAVGGNRIGSIVNKGRRMLPRR